MTIRSSLLGGFEHEFGTRMGPSSQDGMARVKQIHSSICLCAASDGVVGEGDALITDRRGLAISVRTADCFPILLGDPRRGVVAAVHAGWRGTAAGIVTGTIARMKAEFNTDPRDIHAAIGPGIGACCYHVGEDVARRFGREEAGCIDLAEANRRQLIESGVPAAQVQVMTLCTFCDADRFHSFRRDKEQAGRMISYIRLPG
jgi:YfiH family protein